MILYKIKFKRTKDSEWEYGIRTECSTNTILDKEGNIVEGLLYEIVSLHFDFCLNLTPILKN